MPKIAEKLTILVKTGNALLQRLSHTKLILNDPKDAKPAFFNDSNCIKILANATKKFPEITDVSFNCKSLCIIYYNTCKTSNQT